MRKNVLQYSFYLFSLKWGVVFFTFGKGFKKPSHVHFLIARSQKNGMKHVKNSHQGHLCVTFYLNNVFTALCGHVLNQLNHVL